MEDCSVLFLNTRLFDSGEVLARAAKKSNDENASKDQKDHGNNVRIALRVIWAIPISSVDVEHCREEEVQKCLHKQSYQPVPYEVTCKFVLDT